MKRLDNESRQRLSSLNNEKDKINQKKKHSRKQQSLQLNSSTNDSSSDKQRNHDEIYLNKFNSSSSSRWSINNILIPFCLITYISIKQIFYIFYFFCFC